MSEEKNLELHIPTDLQSFMNYRNVDSYPLFKFMDISNQGAEGVHYEFEFENGYGASVIKKPCSYGWRDDLWELALLKFDSEGLLDICYLNIVNYDVLGFLTDLEVIKLLYAIKAGKVDISPEFIIPEHYGSWCLDNWDSIQINKHAYAKETNEFRECYSGIIKYAANTLKNFYGRFKCHSIDISEPDVNPTYIGKRGEAKL